MVFGSPEIFIVEEAKTCLLSAPLYECEEAGSASVPDSSKACVFSVVISLLPSVRSEMIVDERSRERKYSCHKFGEDALLVPH